jgi:hypothetical protein
MNQKKAKWLKGLVFSKNPILLLLIRNYYGSSTQGMEYVQLLRKAKILYKNGLIKNVKGWPTREELRKKGNVIFDELVRPPDRTNSR